MASVNLNTGPPFNAVNSCPARVNDTDMTVPSGIGLPGHFICRYQSTTRQIYIDAFRHGRFLSQADCIKYLLQTNHGLQEGYLTPVSTRRMLLRICSNLHQTYSMLEMTEEVTRVQRYLVALAK